MWNGKLWDLKETISLNAIENWMKSGLRQIESNPGRIFINYKGEDSLEKIYDKVKRSAKNKKFEEPIDVIVIKDGNVLMTIRI